METNAEAIALNALVWTLSDEARAQRLLVLTGLEPGELRNRLGDPTLLAAAIMFLESYEPDLIACADHLGIKPATLTAARVQLEMQ